eukprot:10862157-Karenia_brevis.AAC.1
MSSTSCDLAPQGNDIAVEDCGRQVEQVEGAGGSTIVAASLHSVYGCSGMVDLPFDTHGRLQEHEDVDDS